MNDKKGIKVPFYLNIVFIVFLGCLWPAYGIPLVVAIVLIIVRSKKYTIITKGMFSVYGDLDDVNNKINSAKLELQILESKHTDNKKQHSAEIDQLKNEFEQLKNHIDNLNKDIESLNKQSVYKYAMIEYDDELSSAELKSKLSVMELDEKNLIQSDKALIVDKSMSKKEIKEQSKQLLRCFNSEVSAMFSNLTIKNTDTTRNKLIKSFETLNKIFKIDNVSLSKDLLTLKLNQLDLIHTFKVKEEQEKEQQREIKEQMKEEERVRREIEAEKKKIEKEEKQFSTEVKKLMDYLAKTDNDIEKQLYVDKIKELEDKLNILSEDKKRVFEREANTRAGFVYIISNIGSFGENVFKIGMTRRLEPMDRVNELGSASVPFEFDVHAMIFSDDAPGLENMLHNEFKDNQVNKVNPRKEFFRVALEDVEKVVRERFNATAEFTMLAKAEQYRETLKIEQQTS